MTYLQPSEYETYGLEATTPAALVAAASSRLHVRCGKALDRFSNAARGGLERALLRRLHVFFGDTLYLEYAIFRSKRARQSRSPTSSQR